jgi:hypothetical protein
MEARLTFEPGQVCRDRKPQSEIGNVSCGDQFSVHPSWAPSQRNSVNHSICGMRVRPGIASTRDDSSNDG